VLHDGTVADPKRATQGGAVAVVIAPGAPLVRLGSNEAGQRRECAPGDCDAAGRCLTDPPQRAARCNPANYLDAAPEARFAAEDNADFVDRNDAAGRTGNGNGFIHGPVMLADGRLAVNDRIATVSYADVMPRVMSRVALELAHCLRYYATRPENGGRLPWPERACERGPYFGSIPDTPFTATAQSSGGRMLDRWWRTTSRQPEALAELPAKVDSCRIALSPFDEGPARVSQPGVPDDEASTAGLNEASWWSTWKPFVFYALASGHGPSAQSAGCVAAGACLEVTDAGGRAIAANKQFAILVRQAARRCDTDRIDCGTEGCTRVVAGIANRELIDVAIAQP
jgi:hypothetical protein